MGRAEGENRRSLGGVWIKLAEPGLRMHKAWAENAPNLCGRVHPYPCPPAQLFLALSDLVLDQPKIKSNFTSLAFSHHVVSRSWAQNTS